MSGFENFAVNGFDQFLINVSNEKLQHYFIEYLFPKERQDYEDEGIAWQDIMYHSNNDVLELLFDVSASLVSFSNQFVLTSNGCSGQGSGVREMWFV